LSSFSWDGSGAQQGERTSSNGREERERERESRRGEKREARMSTHLRRRADGPKAPAAGPEQRGGLVCLEALMKPVSTYVVEGAVRQHGLSRTGSCSSHREACSLLNTPPSGASQEARGQTTEGGVQPRGGRSKVAQRKYNVLFFFSEYFSDGPIARSPSQEPQAKTYHLCQESRKFEST